MEQAIASPLTRSARHDPDAVALSIVIVSYNCKELIFDCLGSVDMQRRPLRCEIIVVDNASADGSATAIAEAFPWIRLIALDENVGFARGCNIGAGRARGRLILFLNPDTAPCPDLLPRLLAFAREWPEAGIWGGSIVGEDGRAAGGSCWRFPTLWSTLCVVAGLARACPRSRLFNREAYGGAREDRVRQVEVVSGCLLMIRKELWDSLNGFDPTYFLYSEEVDLCLRARARGASPMVCSDVRIMHHVGGTQAVRADRLIRLLKGKRTYMRKHWSRSRQWAGGMLLLAWPLSRHVALDLASRVLRRPALAESAASWREVWRRRGEWFDGYAPSAGS